MFAFLASHFVVPSRFEAELADQRIVRLAASVPLSDRMMIVAIDDATVARFGEGPPLDRRLLARLVEAVAAGRPRRIGLDVVLDQPSVLGADTALAASIARNRALLVLAGDGPPNAFLTRMAGGARIADAGFRVDPGDRTVRAPSPAGSFADTVAGPVGVGANDRARPQPAYARWSLTRSGELPFPRIPALAVIDGQVDPAIFRGKTVLIGATYREVDRHRTPLGILGAAQATTAGVVIQAYLADATLDSAPLPRRSMAGDIAVLLLCALAGLAIGRANLATWPRVGMLIAACLAQILFTFAVFAASMIVLWIIPAIIALVTGALVGAITAQRDHFNRLRRVEGVMATLIDPAILRRALGPARDAGPEEIELSFLVCDLCDFTQMVDSQPPEFVRLFVNSYIQRTSDIVHAHGGVIDNIAGDGIQAMFGTEHRPDARAAAVACARAILAEADATRGLPRSNGFGAVRIGLHRGTVMFGAFGGPDRREITAHGSPINIAARLVDTCRSLGVTICASEDALGPGHGNGGWRPIGEVQLRGVASPVKVWTLAPEPAP